MALHVAGLRNAYPAPMLVLASHHWELVRKGQVK